MVQAHHFLNSRLFPIFKCELEKAGLEFDETSEIFKKTSIRDEFVETLCDLREFKINRIWRI